MIKYCNTRKEAEIELSYMQYNGEVSDFVFIDIICPRCNKYKKSFVCNTPDYYNMHYVIICEECSNKSYLNMSFSENKV